MEYNTQIEPLINDLKTFHIREYLKSSTFKRFLVKTKLIYGNNAMTIAEVKIMFLHLVWIWKGGIVKMHSFAC